MTQTAELSKPTLRQSVKFGERYVSSALNRKFAGIFAEGVYHGFVVKPCAVPGYVYVTHAEDYPRSVAVVERDGYSLTVTMDDGGYVPIPAPGTWYIVLEAFYVETQPGYQRIVARQEPEAHHVVLAKVLVDDVTTIIPGNSINADVQATAPMHDMPEQVQSLLLYYVNLVTRHVALERHLLEDFLARLQERQEREVERILMQQREAEHIRSFQRLFSWLATESLARMDKDNALESALFVQQAWNTQSEIRDAQHAEHEVKLIRRVTELEVAQRTETAVDVTPVYVDGMSPAGYMDNDVLIAPITVAQSVNAIPDNAAVALLIETLAE